MEEKANLKRGQRGMITIVEMASAEGNSWIAKTKLEKLLLTFLRFFVKSSLLSLLKSYVIDTHTSKLRKNI